MITRRFFFKVLAALGLTSTAKASSDLPLDPAWKYNYLSKGIKIAKFTNRLISNYDELMEGVEQHGSAWNVWGRKTVIWVEKENAFLDAYGLAHRNELAWGKVELQESISEGPFVWYRLSALPDSHKILLSVPHCHLDKTESTMRYEKMLLTQRQGT